MSVGGRQATHEHGLLISDGWAPEGSAGPGLLI